MSDQQEISSDLGSADGPQQDQVHVEGLDSMRIRVTNIVDGFFRFASSRSQSNQSSSAADSATSGSERSSGRSSPSSTGRPRTPPPQPPPPPPSNTSSSPTPIRSKPLRRLSTKKVKFKDHPAPQPPPPLKEDDEDNDTDTPDTNDSPSASPMEPLDAQFEVDKFYMDESSWGVPSSRTRIRDDDSDNPRSASERSRRDSDSSRRPEDTFRSSSAKRNQSYRSSSRSNYDSDSGDHRDGLDASTSTAASWNVHLDPGGNDGTEARIRPASSFEAAGITRPTLQSLGAGGALQNQDDANEPMWFERYMPTWVILVRAFCGSVVLDDRFQLIMVLLITANAICMGLATFDFITDNPAMANLFERIDFIFLCIFTVELALQFGYWGYQVFTDGWLCFDFVTVMSSWLLDGVQVFRSFRVFRAFRLVVRIPILKSLVYAVLHVMPRISSIMGLFALLTYIYAVMATTLYKEYYELGWTGDTDYFGRLDYSLFTLFQFVTLEGWADIVRMVAAHDYFANIIFGSFLTISGFILYSLVVAVVCDSFLLVEAKIRKELKEKAKEAREKRKQLKRRAANRHLEDTTNNFESSVSMAMDESDMELEDLDRRLTMQRSRLSTSRSLGGDAPPPNRPSLAQIKDTSPDWVNRSFIKRPDHRPDIPLSPGAPSQSLIAHPSKLIQDEKLNRSRSRSKSSFKGLGIPEEDLTTDEEDPFSEPQPPSPPPPRPSAVTNTKTLFVGELERKKQSARQRKKKPVRQRIKRVRKRLDKLTAAQSEILSTLDDMCKEMEKRNGIMDDE